MAASSADRLGGLFKLRKAYGWLALRDFGVNNCVHSIQVYNSTGIKQEEILF